MNPGHDGKIHEIPFQNGLTWIECTCCRRAAEAASTWLHGSSKVKLVATDTGTSLTSTNTSNISNGSSECEEVGTYTD